METECVSCKKKTANKHASVGRTRQNRLILVLFVVNKINFH